VLTAQNMSVTMNGLVLQLLSELRGGCLRNNAIVIAICPSHSNTNSKAHLDVM
jgi:hypothetical protein